MERMCGMLTSTAHSRVDANRNMELTLQMTEQKHMLGFVLHPDDWTPAVAAMSDTLDDPDNPGSASQTAGGTAAAAAEDQDGNLHLSRVFTRRMDLSRPPPVRTPLQSWMANYAFMHMVKLRPLEQLERQRLKGYVDCLAHNQGLTHLDSRGLSTEVPVWRWCQFRDDADNSKVDFKVTSARYRLPNNTRNASMVFHDPVPGSHSTNCDNLDFAYAEVQFFFTIWLPAELHGAALIQPDPDDGGVPGTALHELAYVQDIPVSRDGSIVRRQHGGAFRVIAASHIRQQLGLMQKGKEQYLVRRYSTLLWEDA
jgi:hypothetical protein